MKSKEIEKEYAIFGKILRKHRKKNGLSQNALAEMVKLDRTSITNIEIGNQRVMLIDAIEFANVLNFSLDEVKVQVEQSTFNVKLAQQPTKVQSTIENIIKDAKAI